MVYGGRFLNPSIRSRGALTPCTMDRGNTVRETQSQTELLVLQLQLAPLHTHTWEHKYRSGGNARSSTSGTAHGRIFAHLRHGVDARIGFVERSEDGEVQGRRHRAGHGGDAAATSSKCRDRPVLLVARHMAKSCDMAVGWTLGLLSKRRLPKFSRTSSAALSALRRSINQPTNAKILDSGIAC